MPGYAKIFTRILDSTIWRENNPTRLLWITMLALADQDGIVQNTIPGLSDRARISIEECEYALQRFHQPDKYSWSKEFEGRRIQTVDGGWFIINHSKFRELMSVEEVREKTRLRVARWRTRNAKTLQNVTIVTNNASNDIAEATPEAEAKAIKSKSTTKPNPPEVKTLKAKPEDIETSVRTIAAIYPKIADPMHLSQEIMHAIAEAIARHGKKAVIVGTTAMAAMVDKWPKNEHRFIPAAGRYFRESEYLQPAEAWERKRKTSKGEGILNVNGADIQRSAAERLKK